MWHLAQLVLGLCILQASLLDARVLVALEVQQFVNPTGQDAVGGCCDATGDCLLVTDTCDHSFTLCIDNSEDESCPPTSAVTFDGEDDAITNVFSNPLPGGVENPVVLSVQEWPGSVRVKLIVGDRDAGGSQTEVDYLTAVVTETPQGSTTNPTFGEYGLSGNRNEAPTSATMRIAVYCDTNFYGPNCETECVETDDCTGHYSCDPDTGAQVCLPGWSGADCRTRPNPMVCPAPGSFLAMTPQTTSQAAGSCQKVDVVFLIDMDGFMQEIDNDNWESIQGILKSFAKTVTLRRSAVQIGVVTYTNNAQIRMQLGKFQNKEKFAAAVDNIKWTGADSTNMATGLAAARRELLITSPRKDSHKVLILITTGKTIYNRTYVLQEASKLKAKDTDLFILTSGFLINQDDSQSNSLEDLRQVASYPPSDHLVVANSFPDAAKGIVGQLVDKTGSYCEAFNPGRSKRSVPSLRAPFIINSAVDIVLVVDMSETASVQEISYIDTVKTSLKNFVSQVDLSVSQVSIVAFGVEAFVELEFKLNIEIAEIEDTIDALSALGVQSNLGVALQVTRSTVLNVVAGARPDVPKSVVVVCSGQQPSDALLAIAEATAIRQTVGNTVSVIAGSASFTASTSGQATLQVVASEPTADFFIPVASFRTQLTAALTEVASTIEVSGTQIPSSASGQVVFAIEVGVQVNQATLAAVKAFVSQYVAAVDISVTQVAVVTFSDTVAIELGFSSQVQTDKNDIIDVISSIQSRGFGAAVGLTLQTIQTSVLSTTSSVPGAVVIMSSGAAVTNPAFAIQQATLLKNQKVSVFAFTSTGSAAANTLAAVVSSPADFFFLPSPDLAVTLPGSVSTLVAKVDQSIEGNTESGGTTADSILGTWQGTFLCTSNFTFAMEVSGTFTALSAVLDVTSSTNAYGKYTLEGAYEGTGKTFTLDVVNEDPGLTSISLTQLAGRVTIGTSITISGEIVGVAICGGGFLGTVSTIPVGGPRCLNGGTCVRTGNNINDFYCCCPPGFSGSNCSTVAPMNPCSTEECLSNQDQCDTLQKQNLSCSCEDNNPSVVCPVSGQACPTHMYGPACNIFCRPQDSCQGHYICAAADGSKICLPGWTGEDCRQREFTGVVDPECPTDGQCQNGGQCFRQACCCPEGFKGRFCQIKESTDPCQVAPCDIAGNCDAPNQNLSCSCQTEQQAIVCNVASRGCPTHRYGPTCNIECRPADTCEGHYICDPSFGAKWCLPGWIGDECTVRDFPGPGPDPECPDDGGCENGGTCSNKACCCPPGYTGQHCEVDSRPCSSSPCNHGATCKNDGNHYQCLCPSGYTGSNCETPIAADPCYSISCSGACDIINGSFSCVCWQQRVEGNCAVQNDPCPPHFYGPSCSSYCRPTDSCDGHYICDPDAGEKLCLPGWQGLNCTERDFQGLLDPECPPGDTCPNGVCFNQSCCVYVETPEVSSIEPTAMPTAGSSVPPVELSTESVIDQVFRVITNIIGTVSPEEAMVLLSYIRRLLEGGDPNAVGNLPGIRPAAAQFDNRNEARFHLAVTQMNHGLRVVDGAEITSVEYEVDILDPRLNPEDVQIEPAALSKLLSQKHLYVYEGREVRLLKNHFGLFIKGVDLDRRKFPVYAQGIRDAFVKHNKSLEKLQNFRIEVLRADEYIGDKGEEVTKFYYFAVHGPMDEESAVEIGPESLIPPPERAFKEELEKYNYHVNMYHGSKERRYQNSFGIFVDGPVHEKDLPEFHTRITDWWKKNTDIYNLEIDIAKTERFYTKSGHLLTKLVYFVKSSHGQTIIEPSTLKGPTESDLMSQDATVRSASGPGYRFATGASTVDPRVRWSTLRTASTNHAWREKEGVSVFLDGRVVEFDLEKLERQIETNILSHHIDFQGMKLSVVAAEEYVTKDRETVTRLLGFVCNESNEQVIDSRRVATILPEMQQLAKLSAIKRVNGQEYTLAEVDKAQGALRRDSMFSLVVHGALYREDEEAFMEGVKKSYLMTNPDAQKTSRMTASMQQKERYITEDGTYLTKMYYTIEVGKVQVNALVAPEHKIEPADLSQHLTVTKPDTGNYTFISEYEDRSVMEIETAYSLSGRRVKKDTSPQLAVIRRVEDMMTLTVDKPVMAGDLKMVEDGLMTALLSSNTVVMQQTRSSVTVKCISAERLFYAGNSESQYQLGYFVEHRQKTLHPAAFLELEKETVSMHLELNSPWGIPYRFTVTNPASHPIHSLYTVPLVSGVASRDITKVSEQVEEAWTRAGTPVEVRSLGVHKYINEIGDTLHLLHYLAEEDGRPLDPFEDKPVLRSHLTETIDSLTRHGGSPYQVYTEPVGRLIPYEAFHSVFTSRPVTYVERYGFLSSVQQHRFKQKTTEATHITKESLETRLVRQVEMISKDSTTLWRADHLLLMDGMMVYPALLSNIDESAVQNLLPAPPAGQKKLKVKATAQGYHAYSSGYPLTTSLPIRISDYSAVEKALQEGFSEVYTELDDVKMTVVKNEEVVDKKGQLHYQLLFFTFANGTLLDHSVEGSLSTSLYKTKLETEHQVSGARGLYTVTSPPGPVQRLDQAARLFIVDDIPRRMYGSIETALSAAIHNQNSAMQLANTEIISQEDYLDANGNWVTGLSFNIYDNGQQVIPEMLRMAGTGAIRTELDNQDTLKHLTTQLVQPDSTLWRYRHHCPVYMKQPVMKQDLNAIQNLLTKTWISKKGTDFTVEIVTQEEEVDRDGDLIWHLVYFLKKDAVPYNALYEKELNRDELTSSLDQTVSDTSQTYKDLLYSLPVHHLVRMRHLFSVGFEQKAAVTRYSQFDQSLEQAWKEKLGVSGKLEASILRQEAYYTSIGKLVWRMFYSLVNNDELLHVTTEGNLLEDETEAMQTVVTPRGENYTVVHYHPDELTRSSDCYHIFLSDPVVRLDQPKLQASLEQRWKEARKKATVQIVAQEEHITDTGDSVYKMLYLANERGYLVRAPLDAGLMSSDIQNALNVPMTKTPDRKYNQAIYNTDTNNLVPFRDLYGVSFTKKVAPEHYQQIAEELQKTWQNVAPGNTSGLVIDIRKQEEYISPRGEFVSKLLYSIRDGPRLLLAEELPDVTWKSLKKLETIMGPVGSNYQLVRMADALHTRARSAMLIHVDRWVPKVDVPQIEARLKILAEETVPGMPKMTVQYAAQDRLITLLGHEEIQFIFYVKSDNMVLDRVMESPLDERRASVLMLSVMSNRSYKYHVLPARAVPASYSRRHCYSVPISGKVATQDVAKFSSALQSIWADHKSNSSVHALAREEHVGSEGETVVHVLYTVHQQGQLVHPDLESSPALNKLNIEPEQGHSYTVHSGPTLARRLHFSLLLKGYVHHRSAVLLNKGLQKTWQHLLEENLGGMTATLDMRRTEKHFGVYGAAVTNLLYSVVVDGVLYFPENDESPLMETVVPELEKIQPGVTTYHSSKDHIRAEDLFNVKLQGELKKLQKQDLEEGLHNAWQDILPGCTVTLGGREHHVSVDMNANLSQVYYRVWNNRKAVAVEDVLHPEHSKLVSAVSSKAGLSVVNTDSLWLRSVHLSGILDEEKVTPMATALDSVWEKIQKDATDLEVKVTSSERHLDLEWRPVTKLMYAVKPVAQKEPVFSELNEALSEGGASLCGCHDSKEYLLYLYGKAMNQTGTQAGLLKAWAVANDDIAVSKFSVRLQEKSARVKRDLSENAVTFKPTYADKHGELMVWTKYTVAVEGQDPDPAFVARPTISMLKNMLISSTGQKVSASQPELMCFLLTLKGETRVAERPVLTGALSEAYTAANPGLVETLEVRVSHIRTISNNGVIISEVHYCLARTDAGFIIDVAPATDKHLSSAMSKIGKVLYGGTVEDEPVTMQSNRTWVPFVIAGGVVIGVILFLLAIVKVCYRQSQREKEDDIRYQKEKFEADDDDFETAKFKGAIYDNFSRAHMYEAGLSGGSG